jgi:hypothetical protein
LLKIVRLLKANNPNLNPMKKLLLSIVLLFVIPAGLFAQITITDNEMPHSNDALYRTRAGINPFLNYAATGPNHVWNFNNLVATTQDSAIYQTVSSTNFVYALTYADIFFNPNRANHAKPGVDIPFNNLLPITNPYTFYYRSSSIYKTIGFGVELAGIPVPIIFTDHDEIYSLPLNYADTDSTFSAYNLSIPTLAYYGYEQSRMNDVDGWGVITTPAGTFDVLRVKTTLAGKDTINLDSLSIGFAIERPLIREYKWLTTNLRTPVLQINTTEIFGIEIISDIYFYDLPRSITVVPPLGNVICPGVNVDVNYDITGAFNQGGIFVPANNFIAELSDANGDFTNAVNIGSVTSNQPGVITCTIPANTPPGTGYRIRVRSTNPALTGSDNGYDLTLGVPPVATASASGTTEFCSGDSVLLSAATDPGYTYQWQLNGSDITGATTPDLIAIAGGDYTVTVSNACGSSVSSAINVIVHDLPLHTFAQASYLVCDGTSITIVAQNTTGQSPLNYQWLLDGNVLFGEIIDSITTALPGVYTLEINNPATGCSSSVDVTLGIDLVTAPVITATGSTTFCSGDSVQLEILPEPGLTYQWFVDGNSIPGATSISIQASTSGNYSVFATNANGCTAMSDSTITVTSNQGPAPTILNNTSPVAFCQGDSAMLSFIAVVGYDYQWTLDGINITGAIFNQYMASIPGIYSVIATDMNGCTSDASNPVTVVVNPLPAAPVITQVFDSLFASGNGSFQWYLDGALIPGATGSFYIPQVNGNYTVSTTDSLGCSSLSVIFPVVNVGITEISQPVVTLFPNPTSGVFQITARVNSYEWLITDVTGKTLISGHAGKKEQLIDITGFSNGIYLLKISLPDSKSEIIKIVKQ